MSAAAKKHIVKFDDRKLRFSEEYPTELEGILPIAEFDSVVRKVNWDVTAEIKDAIKDVRKWAIIAVGLCALIVGFVLTPLLFIKTKRQKKRLKGFWENLRIYLGEINRKTYLKRNLEWKLAEDKRKLRSRDVVNPLLAYQIEIIHRIPKTRLKSPLGSEELTMSAVMARASRPISSLYSATESQSREEPFPSTLAGRQSLSAVDTSGPQDPMTAEEPGRKKDEDKGKEDELGDPTGDPIIPAIAASADHAEKPLEPSRTSSVDPSDEEDDLGSTGSPDDSTSMHASGSPSINERLGQVSLPQSDAISHGRSRRGSKVRFSGIFTREDEDEVEEVKPSQIAELFEEERTGSRDDGNPT